MDPADAGTQSTTEAGRRRLAEKIDTSLTNLSWLVGASVAAFGVSGAGSGTAVRSQRAARQRLTWRPPLLAGLLAHHTSLVQGSAQQRDWVAPRRRGRPRARPLCPASAAHCERRVRLSQFHVAGI